MSTSSSASEKQPFLKKSILNKIQIKVYGVAITPNGKTEAFSANQANRLL
jgi:hypothetical protein